MKYRIVASKKAPASAAARRKTVELRGGHSLPVPRAPHIAPIENSELFGFGCFFDPSSEPERMPVPSRTAKNKKIRLPAFLRFTARSFATLMGALRRTVSRTISLIVRRLARKRENNLPAIGGALCAALAISLVSAGTVVYKLFIEDYFGSYKTVSVPDFVGSVYPDNNIFSESDYCDISLSYEYDKDTPEGTVISQFPEAGVERRVYSRKNLCRVSLVVSLGERTFTMNDYSGHSLREAVLELKRESVRFTVSEQYSDTVAAGRIISTSPEVGEIFSAEETVTVRVSLGPEIKYVSVPELYGMTEARAAALLESSGLTLGSITYAPSPEPRGTVISQSHTPYSSVREGESISLSVSAGEEYSEKTIPDLYGLSIEEAKERLAEYGLVCGNIYAVANGAPLGTVIAQSPIASSPINAGVVSVDIYVSS